MDSKNMKNLLKEVLFEIVTSDTKPKIEVAPDLKIGIEEVYMKDPDFNRFVISVAAHLRKFKVQFNMKDKEMIEIFVRNLMDTFW